MMLPGRWQTGLLLGVTMSMAFVMGAAIAANDVAAGERRDLHAILINDTFDEDGDLKESAQDYDNPVVPDRLERPLTDDWIHTPRLDRAIREHVSEPLIRGAYRVASWGYQTGYVVAETTAPWVVAWVGNIYALGVVGAWGWRLYGIAQEAR